MLKEERQKQILNILYGEGKVEVDILSYNFHASKDTIRRDLTELEEQGILKRVYGGAIPQKRPVLAVDERKYIEQKEKYIVANKALRMIKPGSLVAIDGGTTNTLLASIMPLSMKLRVVTNSFPVAEELRKRPHIDVIFLGGIYNKESQTTVGDIAVEQLSNYYFDQCFIGAYAIDAIQGITSPFPYEDEISVKKCIVKNCLEINIMGSCDKLDQISNYATCSIEQVNHILCEHPVTTAMNNKYQNKIV